VRYVIFRGSPPAKIKPDFSGDDYWVMTNRRALPRVFVPENVETVEDDRQRLSKLANPEFDPARVAYAESPVNLSGPSQGSAEIVHEIPTEITVSVDMQTPGVVVLADRWDKGWNAYLDGRPVRILRINHAIRGVQVPKGKATLEFRYEPESSVWGLRFAGLSLLVSLSWVGMSVWLRNARQTHAFEPSRPIEAASQGNRTEGTAKTNLREPGTKPPR
jgi:hypothetical protein